MRSTARTLSVKHTSDPNPATQLRAKFAHSPNNQLSKSRLTLPSKKATFTVTAGNPTESERDADLRSRRPIRTESSSLQRQYPPPPPPPRRPLRPYEPGSFNRTGLPFGLPAWAIAGGLAAGFLLANFPSHQLTIDAATYLALNDDYEVVRSRQNGKQVDTLVGYQYDSFSAGRNEVKARSIIDLENGGVITESEHFYVDRAGNAYGRFQQDNEDGHREGWVYLGNVQDDYLVTPSGQRIYR